MNPRRISLAAALMVALAAHGADQSTNATLPVAAGPFRPEQESLQQYRCPEWFRDAKFGIWAHWGPQCVPEDGDWYARRLYLSGVPKPRSGLPHFEPGSAADRGYKLQVERYGHPSKVGYKDIIPLWKAEKWDPKKLMDLYVRAGAKYFVSKNGNLLINVVQKADGEITPEAHQTLVQMADWMAVNRESIFATRPWTVYGEGPSAEEKPELGRFGGARDVRSKPYTAADLRFTAKGNTVYAIALGVPEAATRIKSLAAGKIAGVTVLGSSEKVKWKQEADALVIQPLAKWPSQHAVAFKITRTGQ